jgi:hypothetical protein
MISERTLARSFSGFWTELLPLLTPSFVHVINEGFKYQLTDEFGVEIEPISKNSQTHDYSVVAEFAFFLAGHAVKSGSRINEIIDQKRVRELAERSALEVVKKYEGGRIYLPTRLEPQELKDGFALARNYERFFDERCGNELIEFSPTIPGSGFVSECKADISVGKTLFEVKTVDRNLAGKDIRQLIIYLALQAATGQRRWESAGFFNPRRAVYHEFEVEDLIGRMSGGRSSIEVFQDLIDFVVIRDVQLDTAF